MTDDLDEPTIIDPAVTENELTDEQGDASPITATALLKDAVVRLRRNPRVVTAMVLAGLIVTAVDRLRLGDPIPTTGFVGLRQGHISIAFEIMVQVISHASTPVSSVVSLRPRWLVWTVGLEVVQSGAVVLASVYGFAKLLDTPLTVSKMLRYLLVFAVLGIVSFHVEAGVVIGIPLVIIILYAVVHLVALPGLIVDGMSILAALRRSWGVTAGHGWSLFGVVLVVGFANHVLASIPFVGPLGSSLAATMHVGVVVAFLHRVRD